MFYVGLAGALGRVRGHLLSAELEASQLWEASAAPGKPALSTSGWSLERLALGTQRASGSHVGLSVERKNQSPFWPFTAPLKASPLTGCCV